MQFSPFSSVFDYLCQWYSFSSTSSLSSEGKIPQDEPMILPPLQLISKNEKHKPNFLTQSSKRLDYRYWDREHDRDFELMHPLGSHKKDSAVPMDVDQPIDPDEPTYCICHQVLEFNSHYVLAITLFSLLYLIVVSFISS